MPIYGSPEYSTDNMPILDPKTNKVSFFKMPVADPEMPESLGPGHAGSVKPLEPSAYWGEEKPWDTRANNHNSMFDKKGRLWLAATKAERFAADRAAEKVIPHKAAQKAGRKIAA